MNKFKYIIHRQLWKDFESIYLMESQGRGLIRITREYDNGESSSIKIWTLSDLYVEESFRKAGIGAKLLETAINYCKINTLPGSGEITIATNDHSEAFCDEWYQRLGFKFDHMETPVSLGEDNEELDWLKIYKLTF